MVTNQDGLGTDSFPEHTFWPAHNKMLKTFGNEGGAAISSLTTSFIRSMPASTRRASCCVSIFMLYDYTLDVERLLAATDAKTKVLWICSPNNPTGNAFPRAQLHDIAHRYTKSLVLCQYIYVVGILDFIEYIDYLG